MVADAPDCCLNECDSGCPPHRDHPQCRTDHFLRTETRQISPHLLAAAEAWGPALKDTKSIERRFQTFTVHDKISVRLCGDCCQLAYIRQGVLRAGKQGHRVVCGTQDAYKSLSHHLLTINHFGLGNGPGPACDEVSSGT